ncbi:MAG: TetR/AcrR family transcriptional regulator [bacterium]|nr:TetR/AcrR family transcriptional regulator [bacterium]
MNKPKRPAASLVAESISRESNSHLQKRAEKKLEALLASAADLMARHGYARTSIRDVARETGCSLAGMYYYFRSKEELLFQIQFHTFSAMLAEQEKNLQFERTAEEKLTDLVRTHLSFYSTHTNEMKVCNYELETMADDQFKTIETIRRKYYKIFAEVVEALLGRTSRRAADRTSVRRTTMSIFGMLNWIYMWFDPERDGPMTKLGDEMITFILGGLKECHKQ